MKPLFSIVIRTVRRTGRLRECLRSVADQTFRGFEVVIVDMSDGLATNVIGDFRSTLPKLVHLQTTIRSRPASLNHGIKHAMGEWIAILDDDNRWEIEHLATLARATANSRLELIYTGVQRQTFTPSGDLIHEERVYRDFDFDQLLRGNYIFAAATSYRKEVWRRVSGYDERFPVYEDWEFLIRAARLGKVVSVPSFTAICRNFTGQPGVPEHSLREADDCARCLAAVRWKHRRFCPEAIAENYHSTELRQLLLTWWWHNQRNHFLTWRR